jgi:hypothetical protein
MNSQIPAILLNESRSQNADKFVSQHLKGLAAMVRKILKTKFSEANKSPTVHDLACIHEKALASQ